MTPEELDEARAKEAQRLWESGQEAGSSSWVVAARLARENWTPPEPVDPDILAWREWGKRNLFDRDILLDCDIDAGEHDSLPEAKAYLAGARMARAEKLSLLNWLSDQKSLEVSWGGDPEENGAWSVYRVTGGLNDREWHLLATGETPLAALKSARSTLAKYRGEAR